ncbi:MAG: hypothetical protein EOP52_06855 [Sphingobacteriales bacterium]|nr:MAG: hypothetical protein EOP52_06855 [Sphingobacteriales bacterium]
MKKILLFALIAGLFAACKKEDTPSRKSLLTGTWRRTFDAQDTNRNQTLDAAERKLVTDMTVLNAVYTFKDDGSGTIIGSGTTIPFNWALTGDDQQFVFSTATSGSDTSYIHTLTSGDLVLEYRRQIGGYYWRGLRK